MEFRFSEHSGELLRPFRLDRLNHPINRVVGHDEPGNKTLVELQIPEHALKQVLKDGLDAAASGWILEDLPQPADRHGQIARNSPLYSLSESSRQQSTQGPLRLEKASGRACKCPVDGLWECVAFNDLGKPCFGSRRGQGIDSGVDGRLECRALDPRQRRLFDAVGHPLQKDLHLSQGCRRQVVRQASPRPLQGNAQRSIQPRIKGFTEPWGLKEILKVSITE